MAPVSRHFFYGLGGHSEHFHHLLVAVAGFPLIVQRFADGLHFFPEAAELADQLAKGFFQRFVHIVTWLVTN